MGQKMCTGSVNKLHSHFFSPFLSLLLYGYGSCDVCVLNTPTCVFGGPWYRLSIPEQPSTRRTQLGSAQCGVKPAEKKRKSWTVVGLYIEAASHGYIVSSSPASVVEKKVFVEIRQGKKERRRRRRLFFNTRWRLTFQDLLTAAAIAANYDVLLTDKLFLDTLVLMASNFGAQQ